MSELAESKEFKITFDKEEEEDALENPKNENAVVDGVIIIVDDASEFVLLFVSAGSAFNMRAACRLNSCTSR